MRVACVRHDFDPGLAGQMAAAGSGLRILDAGGLWDVRVAAILARQLRRERIDIVHVHLSAGGFLGGLAARLSGRPVVATLHSVADDRRTHPLRRRVLVDVATRRFPTEIVAVSDAVRSTHLDALALPPGRVTVVRNVSIARELLPPGFDPERARAALGLGTGPALCMAARLALPKDHDTLLRAVAELVPDHPGLTLLVAGEGPRRAELRALADDLGLGDRVRFLGQRSDVIELLAAVDVVCNLTHEAEGLSITVLDAMRLGRPVLATRIPSVAEVLEDGRAGVLVTPRDVGAAAAALRRLLGDPHERARLGERARAHSLAALDPQRWMGAYEAVYARAAASRRAATWPGRNARPTTTQRYCG
jgi:glycosyltransferase involved in cell wall biosynthesis